MLFEKTKIYGVTGVGKSATLTRTDDAKNLSWQSADDGSGIISDFDTCFPWSDMQEIELASSVFIKIPKFYAKVSANADGSYKYQISGCRYEGFSTLFIDGKGNEIDYVLVGKYEATNTLSSMTTAVSRTNSSPFSDTFASMQDYCKSNGDGYQQYDFLIDGIIKLLFTVEFATTDAQSVMAGLTTNKAYKSGETDLVIRPSGNSSQELSSSLSAIKYRGIENIFGGRNIWCDGIYLDNNKVYLCTDPTQYDSIYPETTYIEAPYFCVGSSATGSTTYYTSEIQPFAKIPLLSFVTKISTIPTDESAVFGNDVFDVRDSSHRVACGGDVYSGQRAGIWAFYGDSAIDNVAGGRLCYKPI